MPLSLSVGTTVFSTCFEDIAVLYRAIVMQTILKLTTILLFECQNNSPRPQDYKTYSMVNSAMHEAATA